MDEHTHVEVGRYPQGSDAMGLLATIQVGPGNRFVRPLKYLWAALRHPLQFLGMVLPFGWARRTIILTVMQTLDNAMEFVLSRRWYWPFRKVLRSRNLSGKPIPTYIEGANKTASALARRIGGTPQNAVTEVLLGVPITAHILGGCVMGRDAESGVVNKHGKVFGQDEMYVVDGSIVSANLGVNPSLTITALSEHVMSQIPDRADRPADWPRRPERDFGTTDAQ